MATDSNSITGLGSTRLPGEVVRREDALFAPKRSTVKIAQPVAAQLVLHVGRVAAICGLHAMDFLARVQNNYTRLR